jgi:hypothetical protein
MSTISTGCAKKSVSPDYSCYLKIFVCNHSVCPQFPWRQFAAAEEGSLRAMIHTAVSRAGARCDTEGEHGQEEIFQFLVEYMTQTERIDDDTLPRSPPRLIGREHQVQIRISVHDFHRYRSTVTRTEWFNDVNIGLFLRGLAFIQQGEIHRRTDLQSANGQRWRQHRLLGAGKPHVFMVSEQWSNRLFTLRGTGLATRQNRGDMAQFMSMDLPANWTDTGTLRMVPNIRDGPGRNRQSLKIANKADFSCAVWPINITDSHWLSVVSCNTTGTLYLYDFLFVPGSSWHDKFKRRILNAIGEYLNDKCQPAGRSIDWKHKIVITARLQEDGSNCGALLCLVALRRSCSSGINVQNRAFLFFKSRTHVLR